MKTKQNTITLAKGLRHALPKVSLLMFAAIGAKANAGVDLNQTWPPFALKKTQQPCLNQNLEFSQAAFSSMVAEQVTFSGSRIHKISIAVWFGLGSTATNFLSLCSGWSVYVGTTAELASGGGLVAIVGPSSTTIGGEVPWILNSRRLEVSGLNIAVTPGTTKNVALVPHVDSIHGGIWLLRNSLVGPNNGPPACMFFNPGNGFGLGASVPVTYNAAMRVETL
ncbi:MAG: hypothetical protein JNM34_06405 [Chthonomonadaceae bacterium]|nr:hypothetical protein [Chthonomonadaceae bacterium]